MSDRDGDLEVYTMRPNGSSVRQLTFNDALEFRPNWSPDGAQITFTTTRDDNAEVYVMDADGTNQTNVTANPPETTASAPGRRTARRSPT